MKELTEFILKNIVNHPDAVEIKEEKKDDQVNLKIRVHPDDLPRVIGKEGKVIRSIRNLVKIAARKKNLWVNLELEE